MIKFLGKFVFTVLIMGLPVTAVADDLFKDNSWASLATDLKASEIGDVLLVHVVQTAEASHFSQQSQRKSSSLSGNISVPGLNESADAAFGRGFDGRGDIRRGESLLTHLSVVITNILPNGNYVIEGEQTLVINQEATTIRVKGVIRPEDIFGENTIYSHRIANAQIQYDGSGFVTRGAKPGFFDKIFGFLGLI